MSGDLRRTAARLAVLEAAERDELGWSCKDGSRITYRHWIDEYAYNVITGVARPLVAAGVLKRWYNPANHTRGSLELTPEGWALLRSWRSSAGLSEGNER